MFDRLERLIGIDNVEKIGNTKILLVGVGGVGGFVLEALVRCGIKNITVVDGDNIDLSNLNRQIITNGDNIGKSKVDEAIKRAKLINCEINIKGINEYIKGDNINNYLEFDYIVDACDDVSAKVELIKFAKNNNIKIISAMGTGKRMDPSKVVITTLDKTINDPLAKVMRNKLKKEVMSLKIPVVYSTENPWNRDTVISSSVFVPSVAGINIAYYIINDILKSS